MKHLLFIFGLLAAGLVQAEGADQSKNAYQCQIWEPNLPVVEARVDPSHQIHVHSLQDGLHEVEIHWWHWTLNVSVLKKGQVPEVLGAASHTNLKLRSHAPDVSVWCDKEERLEGFAQEANCRTECQVWYPMPRNCRRVCG